MHQRAVQCWHSSTILVCNNELWWGWFLEDTGEPGPKPHYRNVLNNRLYWKNSKSQNPWSVSVFEGQV